MILPLFPLNTVLFPDCVLDLQIFEARYLDMITRCMKQGTGFGVVCLLEGDEAGNGEVLHAPVGCEAMVVDFNPQNNGLLGIRVKGTRRFEVKSCETQRDRLLLGEVEYLYEFREEPLSSDEDDLLALLNALAEHPMVAALGMLDGARTQQSLANQLGYLLPFLNGDKLRLLCLDDPRERLDNIQTLLDELQGELFD
ncbi:MAG: LON peptidase substrate-binding domain-containing protein [Janthinobacterium lividum]|uniref:LON peptidase substrate-binding domain-containing protein n=1 Tax=Pseudomonas TaxID=286 RepID=UPI001CFA3FF3|nr:MULTISPECIES: LON peptidase substrate-binding domain-containing protein [Pseudomonas]